MDAHDRPDMPYPGLRAACPALERLLQSELTATVDGAGVLHADPICAGPASFPDRKMSHLELQHSTSTICNRCSFRLSRDTKLLADLLRNLTGLRAGPPQPGASFDLAPRGLTSSLAAMYTASLLNAESVIDAVGGEHADALRRFVDELGGPWRRWFEQDGAAELVLLARLAGTSATVGRAWFVARTPDVALPGAVDAGAASQAAFDHFVAAHLSRAADPYSAAVEAALADANVFPAGGDGPACTAEVATLIRLFDSQAALDGDDDGLTVVLAETYVWNAMFWSAALALCFPSVKCENMLAIALPKMIADLVTEPRDGQVGRLSTSPRMGCAEAAEVLTTVATLLRDGMEPAPALATAVGVVT